MVDIPVPRVTAEIMTVVQAEEKLVPLERVQWPTVENAPVPQILEETVEVVLATTERVQRRTVDVPTLQVLEETVEVAKLNPCERVQQRTGEQIVDVPQFQEVMVRLVPQECVQCIDEQMGGAIPQITEEIGEGGGRLRSTS